MCQGFFFLWISIDASMQEQKEGGKAYDKNCWNSVVAQPSSSIVKFVDFSKKWWLPL